MKQEIIHVYLMPGMAANPNIFEHIKLPEDQFEIHWLEWMIPNKKESLESYSRRMIDTHIKHDNIVLLGVSFGGILAQEISKYMTLRKLFVVSSLKSKHELPKRMKVMKYTKAYKLLPTRLVSNIDFLAKYAFGETVTKRIELYKKYLSVSDRHYLDWAIENVIEWDQEKPNEDAIYIHGNKDAVFPHSCVGNCIVLMGGTHIMVINRYKWFNKNLPKLILQ